MIIPFEALMSHITKPVHGILHIGAHLCEELELYKKYLCDNIIWIEADPKTCRRAEEMHPEQVILNYLVTDENDVFMNFNVANNNESSSILKFGTHKIYHTNVVYIGEKILRSKRIDAIYEKHTISDKYANFLNIDIQGVELLALKSMGNLLNNFDYVYLEVNTEEVYENCCLLEDIKGYLGKFGFEMKLISMTVANWGDAFFVKQGIINL